LAEFLKDYGASDVRRERMLKRFLLFALVAVVVGLVLYFNFRNFREERQSRLFIELLGKRDYQSAYKLWGCTPEAPCRDYNYEKFLSDWGPQSPHADLSRLKKGKTQSCQSGILETLEFPGEEPLYLLVERGTLTLSYAPWPTCVAPRFQAP
jgi:hypothetical protein